MRIPITLSLIIFLLIPVSSEARVIHREKSLYSNILIDQKDSVICLKFSIRRKKNNQSCIDTESPNQFVLEYVRIMMATLAAQEKPKSILMIGMGGGTIPLATADLYPETKITIVEIDPAVLKMAEKYFYFTASSNTKIQVQDGRVFIKRAIQNKEQFDVVLLDAFNGDYIPEHLLTQEFLYEVRRVLSPDGTVISNTFESSRLAEHESATYASVFPNFITIQSEKRGNRIIVATKSGDKLSLNLDKLSDNLNNWLLSRNVNAALYQPLIQNKPKWNKKARLLTDQYSPANLLIHR